MPEVQRLQENAILPSPAESGNLSALSIMRTRCELLGKGEPFILQRDDWSCGASVLLNALRVLSIDGLEYDDAVHLTGANPATGTDNANLVRAFRSFTPALDVQEKQGASLPDLATLIESGWLVVVNFRHPVNHEGHYGLVECISDAGITLFDPESGPGFFISHDNFDWRGSFNDETISGWYLAVHRSASGAQFPHNTTLIGA